MVVVQCDYCGKMMKTETGKNQGYYEIQAYRSYDKRRRTTSDYPKTILTCDLCSGCFDELVKQIREKRKNAS